MREFPFPIVLWVTPQILTQLSSKAPDFWSWRGGVFRFTAPAFVSDRTNFAPTIDSSFKPESASDLPIDELLEQVAQISAKNPNSATLSTLFDRLGQAYTDRIDGNGAENRARAIEYFQRALVIQGKLSLKHSKVHTLLRLGKIYSRLGDYQQTELSAQEALTIATELGDKSSIASSLNELGYLTRKRGNYDEAAILYRQSLKLHTELDDLTSMAITLVLLGDVARNQGNWHEAEDLYQQALAFRTKLGDRSGMAAIWERLAFT